MKWNRTPRQSRAKLGSSGHHQKRAGTIDVHLPDGSMGMGEHPHISPICGNHRFWSVSIIQFGDTQLCPMPKHIGEDDGLGNEVILCCSSTLE